MWTNDVQVLLCKDTQDVCAIIVNKLIDKRHKMNIQGESKKKCDLKKYAYCSEGHKN